MTRITIFLLSVFILILTACEGSTTPNRYSPKEEQLVAHDYLAQANAITSEDDNHKRLALFDKATLHFANIVVRDDADDTLRADALYTLRWIEAYVKHDYELALQYLNQYLAIVGPEHESYPTCLAYKADDLWHFGAQDSALYYAYKALSLPHSTNDRIEYICHHVMWNIYESIDMPDSASVHKAMHMRVKGSREFVPLTMEELKSSLKNNVITQEDADDRITIYIITGLVVIGCIVFALTIRRRIKDNTLNETRQYDVEANSSGRLNTGQTEALCNALAEGRRAFELSSVYTDICSTKVSEREWLAIDNEQIRQVENVMLDSFKEACILLLNSAELNDQELLCSLYMYLGYPNTVIAHIAHTTTATIRKRKERLRKKLNADLYYVIINEKR